MQCMYNHSSLIKSEIHSTGVEIFSVNFYLLADGMNRIVYAQKFFCISGFVFIISVTVFGFFSPCIICCNVFKVFVWFLKFQGR